MLHCSRFTTGVSAQFLPPSLRKKFGAHCVRLFTCFVTRFFSLVIPLLRPLTRRQSILMLLRCAACLRMLLRCGGPRVVPGRLESLRVFFSRDRIKLTADQRADNGMGETLPLQPQRVSIVFFTNWSSFLAGRWYASPKGTALPIGWKDFPLFRNENAGVFL